MKSKFADIIPPEKRSIRNIPLPTREGRDRELSHQTTDGIRSNPRTVHHGSADYDAPATVPVKIRSNDEAPAQSRKSRSSSGVVSSSNPDSSTRTRINNKKDFEEFQNDRSAGYTGLKYTGYSAGNEKEDVDVVDDDQESYGKSGRGKRKHSLITWFVLLLIVLGTGYLVSAHFAHADITINLAKHDLSFADETISLNNVDFTVMTATTPQSTTVDANGLQKVSKKATGTIVIYNTSNSTSQKLEATTRFTTPDGLVYRLDSGVTVPAVSKSGGKVIAGSVSASITADQAGAQYNEGLQDFTIPAFKGTDNYTNFYARSKTALSGGFVGNVPNINQTDLANSALALKKTIVTQGNAILVKMAKAQDDSQPNATVHDYVFIPNSSIVDYSDPVITQAADGKSAVVTVNAAITGLMVSDSSFAKLLVQQSQSDESVNANSTATSTLANSTSTENTASGTSNTNQANSNSATQNPNTVYSGDYSGLTITLPSNLSSASLMASANASSTSVTITADGDAGIYSSVDTVSLAAAVSHLSRQQAADVIKNMVNSTTIEVDLKPWWMTSLPDGGKINIKIEK